MTADNAGLRLEEQSDAAAVREYGAAMAKRKARGNGPSRVPFVLAAWSR